MELKRPTPMESDRLSPAEKDALILKLFESVEALERRLKELEDKVEKTSRSSSKPPASDGLKKGAAEPRRRGEKPTCGQPGRPGVTRRMVEHPDEIRALRHDRTVRLRGVAGRSVGHRRRTPAAVRDSRTDVRRDGVSPTAGSCGRVHRGEFPAGVTPHVSYGPRLKAYAVGLVQGHFVALERASALIGDQYGIQPSGGTLQKWVLQVAHRLAPAHEANRRTILKSEVVHCDESGLRVNGRFHWLHVAATHAAVYDHVHAKRGRDAMDAAGILPRLKGHALHDHWKPYRAYRDCTHSLCNAHHLRELRYCEEVTGHFWPIAVRRLPVEGKDAVPRARVAGLTALESAYVADRLARYDEQVANGLAACPVRPPEPECKGRPKQHEATNLLLRLRDFKTQIWGFLRDWPIPFDNNLAERMVRPVKVKLKLTGGFRALGGSEAFCILRSIWDTDKLKGINPFTTLRLAFVDE